MIKFRENLYTNISEEALRKAKRKLKSRRGSLDIYLIVLNHDSGKAEYFHNAILRQNIMFKRDYDVIGLAKSESECREIILRIVAEALDSTGECDIMGYLG